MTLQVPFAYFAETVRRHGAAHVYLAPYGDGSLATARCADGVIASLATESFDATREKLTADGLNVLQGQWEANLTLAGSPAGPLWVAAVVYPSSEGKPGVWIDAYDTAPTEAQVLREMYEEFVSTGQTEDLGFDPFLRLVNPQVVIVAPDALMGYAKSKDEQG